MQENLVLVENRQGIQIITINNPPANSMTNQVILAVDQAVKDAAADEQVRCVILTGQGDRVFISGADISELESFDEATAVKTVTLVKTLCDRILTCPKPTIAAINGHAFGGGLEIAMCCDFRVSTQKAKFGLPEINLAVMPASGGTQLLPRLVGAQRARWMMLSGEAVNAEQALEMNLIDRIPEENNLLDATVAMGEKLAAKAPLAYASIKKALAATGEMLFTQAMEEETRLFAKLCETRDKAEGVRAFKEKRKPVFKGV